MILIEIKEAIERIKEHIEIHYAKEPRAIYISEALYKAIYALRSKEKLKPIPLQTYNKEYQYTDYKCPSCGKRVSDGNPNNCCHCGQALDWSKD